MGSKISHILTVLVVTEVKNFSPCTKNDLNTTQNGTEYEEMILMVS